MPISGAGTSSLTSSSGETCRPERLRARHRRRGAPPRGRRRRARGRCVPPARDDRRARRARRPRPHRPAARPPRGGARCPARRRAARRRPRSATRLALAPDAGVDDRQMDSLGHVRQRVREDERALEDVRRRDPVRDVDHVRLGRDALDDAVAGADEVVLEAEVGQEGDEPERCRELNRFDEPLPVVGPRLGDDAQPAAAGLRGGDRADRDAGQRRARARRSSGLRRRRRGRRGPPPESAAGCSSTVR